MSPTPFEATLFRRDSCALGESPFWYENKFWWIDSEKGRLYSMDDQSRLIDEMGFGQQIGTVVPISKNTLLAALKHEIVEVDLHSKSWKTAVAAADFPDNSRFNDGKADPVGRFLVGTMDCEGKKGTSALYCLKEDRSLRKLKDGLSVSNGLAWSSTGERMYLIDTPEHCVFSYAYNLERGALSDEQIVLKFSAEEGMPDGMTIDHEGCLWISFWDGWSVRRYLPGRNEALATIKVPCSQVTSCCLGGPGLNRLLITTARQGLDEGKLREQPLAGSLFIYDLQTAGYPVVPFIPG